MTERLVVLYCRESARLACMIDREEPEDRVQRQKEAVRRLEKAMDKHGCDHRAYVVGETVVIW
jgi:hypothetical protein